MAACIFFKRAVRFDKYGLPLHSFVASCLQQGQTSIFFNSYIVMTRKKKPLPLLSNVTITDFAAEGKSLVRIDDKVVFVPFAMPGDVVDLQLVRQRRAYSEARVVRYVAYSADRIAPRCAHFGVCGGCKWQMVPYAMQLQMKQQQVEEQLRRIGHVELPPTSPILGSEEQYEYRNKLEFGCSNKQWLTAEQIAQRREEEQQMSQDAAHVQRADRANVIGFHITGVFDKILPIEQCHLMPPLHNELRNAIAALANDMEMPFYDARAQQGLLRDIIVRHTNTDEWMLIVQFCMYTDEEQCLAMELLRKVKAQFPQLTSILYVNNTKCNDTFNDLEVHTFYGNYTITATMEDLTFRVGPKSFYQTNSAQAYMLYSTVRRLANLTGNETVYDLYTGTGTIALFVARHAAKVVGIEYVEEAIADAKANAKVNGIDNVSFFAGDMKDMLTADFIARHGTPDLIITDPPRAGMHPDVVKTLLHTAPQRIVYVSCNPATQARDLAMLDDLYRVEVVQPVDMFPHTPHVENVVLLVKRDS